MRFKINDINPGLTFAVLTLLITTIGCSGGGSVDPSINTPLTGVFLDSPVDGLGYETDTMQGVTGPGGVFSYHSGESIRFFIGDMELGVTEAMPIVTPIDCVEGAIDETDPMVTNMLIFLQSIDFDNDPENGIDITELMHQEAIKMHLDLNFDLDPLRFREDYDFQDYLDLMNSRGMFNTSEGRFPPEIEQARAHMQTTILEYGLYGYGSGSMNQGDMMLNSGN
jgi:para-nitrobenzyl esterase